MTLQRLNTIGPRQAEAQGIMPPMMRAMVHIGYAIAVADNTTDAEWTEEPIQRALEEIQEAFKHINSAHAVDLTPFISPSAITSTAVIKEQLSEVPEVINNSTRREAFNSLAVLADNMTYIAAVAENYLTGGSADEGRNP